MTLLGVVAAVIAIVVLTVRQSLQVGRHAAGAVDGQAHPWLPPWGDIAIAGIAVVVLLFRLWELST